MDMHRHRRACPGRGMGRGQRFELGAPSDEERRPPHGRVRGGARRRARAERRPRFGALQAVLRTRPKQGHAKLVQVRGNGCQLGRRDRPESLLHREDLADGTVERQPSGQRLVQEDADAVPVAGGPHRIARRLLGRHVRGSPDHTVPGPADRIESAFRYQPEIDQHHAPAPGDHHVGGLDVAVQPAGRVQRIDADGQLAQRGPKPVEVADLCVWQVYREVVRLGQRADRWIADGCGRHGAARDSGRGRILEGPRFLAPGPRASRNPRAETHAVEELHREEPRVPFPEKLVE